MNDKLTAEITWKSRFAAARIYLADHCGFCLSPKDVAVALFVATITSAWLIFAVLAAVKITALH